MQQLLLKDFRLKSGLLQREVADVLNVTQSNYHKLESGKSILNAKQILALCELFDCSPNDLLGFRGVHTVIMGKLDGEV